MKARLSVKIAGAVFLTLASGPVLRGDGSFSKLDFEDGVSGRSSTGIAEENLLLKTQMREAQTAIKSLSNSLTIANREAESYRRENAELKLMMEALGVDGLGADHQKLEQRLLKAVADMKLLAKEKEILADELAKFAEATLRFIKTATDGDPEALAAIEGSLRNIPGLITGESNSEPESGHIASGAVISIKEELSLVVANVGSQQGVKVGMPFRIFRGENPIGTVRAVDVREKICGAVIQSLDIEENKIKVGDRLKVDAR